MKKFLLRCGSAVRKARLAHYKYLRNIPSSVELLGPVQVDASNVKFGKNVTLYPGAQIWGTGQIVIGDNVAIGKDTIIFSAGQVTIGNDSAIAAQSYIIDCDHGMARGDLIRRQPLEIDPIHIGCDVWIGAGAKVLKGSRIGDGAVVGAQSLVRGELEPFSIYVGIPARKISERR